MCDDAPDGVCATGSFLLGGFSGGMGGFVGMILNHPVVGVFGRCCLCSRHGTYCPNRQRQVLAFSNVYIIIESIHEKTSE